jgi:hypothetical protein
MIIPLVESVSSIGALQFGGQGFYVWNRSIGFYLDSMLPKPFPQFVVPAQENFVWNRVCGSEGNESNDTWLEPMWH